MYVGRALNSKLDSNYTKYPNSTKNRLPFSWK